MLTDAQSAQINNTEVYTLDYEAEALQSYRDTGDDLMDELEVRATNVILEQTGWDAREDLGGITVGTIHVRCCLRRRRDQVRRTSPFYGSAASQF